MNFKAFLAWSDDLNVRKNSLRSFAESLSAPADQDDLNWSDGQYLMLHFDLMAIGPLGPLNRSSVFEAINAFVEHNRGTRLGSSVYIAPLLPRMPSQRSAALFWNELCDILTGLLVCGDSFYLHHASSSQMGGIAQMVPEGKKTLEHVQVPATDASFQ
jgi:hypothetical protein